MANRLPIELKKLGGSKSIIIPMFIIKYLGMDDKELILNYENKDKLIIEMKEKTDGV